MTTQPSPSSSRRGTRRIAWRPSWRLLAADPSVTEVIVVDDESSDGTADARPRARGDRDHRCPAPAGLGGQAVGSRPGPAGRERRLGRLLRRRRGAVTRTGPGARRSGAGRRARHGQRGRPLRVPDGAAAGAPPRLAHDARLPVRSSGALHPPGPGGCWPTGSAPPSAGPTSSPPAVTRPRPATSPTTSHWPAASPPEDGGPACSTAPRPCESACTRAPATPGARGGDRSPCPTPPPSPPSSLTGSRCW